MDSGEYHHRFVVRRYIGDLLIHVEEVAVALCHCILAKTVDGVAEIEEHGKTGVVDTEALVAAFLGGTRCNITGYEVTECRVAALEIVVAILFGNLRTANLTCLKLLSILKFLGNPDAAVVTKRLRHEGQL